jgi:acetyl-CoA carboxylase beta subunit
MKKARVASTAAAAAAVAAATALEAARKRLALASEKKTEMDSSSIRMKATDWNTITKKYEEALAAHTKKTAEAAAATATAATAEAAAATAVARHERVMQGMGSAEGSTITGGKKYWNLGHYVSTDMC